MIRHSPAVAVLLALAWGCSGGTEIPTVEVGGPTGARLMNGQAKSPAEAYENAYATLTRAHYNVHRNLEARGQNQVGAREALAQILRSLETMKACVAADAAAFDPYLARYAGWQKDLEAGTWGGAFLTDLERTERELKTKFAPPAVKLLAEFPGTAKPVPPAPKSTEPTFTPDKVELPASNPPASGEAQRPVAPEPPPVNPAVKLRVLYKGWDKAHNDLVAVYKEKKDCRTAYADVIAALQLLKEQHVGEKAATLQIYIDYYGDIDGKTKTFTVLPDKTTAKDILDELDVAARVLRKKFNPD